PGIIFAIFPFSVTMFHYHFHRRLPPGHVCCSNSRVCQLNVALLRPNELGAVATSCFAPRTERSEGHCRKCSLGLRNFFDLFREWFLLCYFEFENICVESMPGSHIVALRKGETVSNQIAKMV